MYKVLVSSSPFFSQNPSVLCHDSSDILVLCISLVLQQIRYLPRSIDGNIGIHYNFIWQSTPSIRFLGSMFGYSECIMMMFVPRSIYCFIWQQKNEVMQKQLEALSFLDKRKATKPKVVADQAPSVSGAPLSSDQVIVPVQQQTSGYMVSS